MTTTIEVRAPSEQSEGTRSQVQRWLKNIGETVAENEPLIEVDFGRWSGMTFDELERDGAWRRFNEHRATAGVPGGERAIDVQARAVAALDRIRAAHPGGRIAVVSHADVIRVAVLHCLGAPLDFVHRIEIAPAVMRALSARYRINASASVDLPLPLSPTSP